MKNRRNRNGGFTLVEVIVVLVALGVLAAVLIPSMTGWIDDSQAKACVATRESILQQFDTADVFLLSEGKTATLEGFLSGKDEYAAYAGALQGLTCPDGGVYSAKDGSIYCSVHGDMLGKRTEGLSYVQGADSPEVTLNNAWAVVRQEQAQQNYKGTIDSTAISGIRAEAMQKWLAENGVNLIEQNVQTWKITSEGGYNMVYWSDQSILELPLGTKVKVIRYNPITKRYTAGYLPVTTATGDGTVPYNVLANFGGNWSEAPGQSDDSKQSYETTVKFFNDLPATK